MDGTEQDKDESNKEHEQQHLKSRWLTEISLTEKRIKNWEDTARRIIKRYRNEKELVESGAFREATGDRFAILWSNVSTLQPAIYARRPNPEISRRFKQRDPVSRIASLILERNVSECIDSYDFHTAMKAVRDDYLLPGRGQAWIRYVPTYHTMTNEQGQPVLDEQGNPQQQVVYEEVVTDYIDWRDFLHGPGRRWNEVMWVARRIYMNRAQLEKEFGKLIADATQLGYLPDEISADSGVSKFDQEFFKKAIVFEIWDKTTRKVYWVSKGYAKGPLKTEEDPLQLRDFFPCPRPLYATLTNDSLIPVPDYVEYADQACELDVLTSRINCLLSALRVAGVCDASCEGLTDLLTGGSENKLIPVKNWPGLMQQGGIEGAIQWLPIEQIAKVLLNLYEARESLKRDIFEITGMSDIIRGNSDPRETATAQQLKGRFATLRLTDRQSEMQRFVRDVIALKAEIIAEHFAPETLAMVAGVEDMTQADQQLFQEAVQLLRDDKLRTFKIDIETDSTISLDEDQEKQDRNEFLTAVGGFMQQMLPLASSAPPLLPFLGEALMFTVRGFKAGRELEGVIEEAMQALKAKAEENMAKQQSQPQQDPEAMKAQAQMQTEQMKLQMQMQKQQADLEFHRVKLESELAIEREKLELERQRSIATIELDREKSAAELESKRRAVLVDIATKNGGESLLPKRKIARFGTDEMGNRIAEVTELPIFDETIMSEAEEAKSNARAARLGKRQTARFGTDQTGQRYAEISEQPVINGE